MARLFSLLKRIYYGSTPGALRGADALYLQARKQRIRGVTLGRVREFLSTQPVYTRYRRARKNYPRNPIVANYPGETVQVDIMDMSRQSRGNQNRYVLLSYDTFSKFLSGIPLANRQELLVKNGLQALVNGSPFPWSAIYWDKEGSFLSHRVQSWLKQQKIHNYTTKSIVKAPGVERAIRTLRSLLQRRFEASKSLEWETLLPLMIANYNRRKHSVTKLAPKELAIDPVLIADVPHQQRPPRKIALPPIGAFVRLNRLRGIFEKEASGTWTEEVFRVVRHNTSQPIPLVYIEDLTGMAILGGLYPEEYQHVSWSGQKEIDKVIKTRKRDGKIEYYVSYRGWPRHFNAWVRTKPKL